jgi:hypothetical protein
MRTMFLRLTVLIAIAFVMFTAREAPEASAHTYYQISCSQGVIRPMYHGYPFHIPGPWRNVTAAEYWTYCY